MHFYLHSGRRSLIRGRLGNQLVHASLTVSCSAIHKGRGGENEIGILPSSAVHTHSSVPPPSSSLSSRHLSIHQDIHPHSHPSPRPTRLQNPQMIRTSLRVLQRQHPFPYTPNVDCCLPITTDRKTFPEKDDWLENVMHRIRVT